MIDVDAMRAAATQRPALKRVAPRTCGDQHHRGFADGKEHALAFGIGHAPARPARQRDDGEARPRHEGDAVRQRTGIVTNGVSL